MWQNVIVAWTIEKAPMYSIFKSVIQKWDLNTVEILRIIYSLAIWKSKACIFILLFPHAIFINVCEYFIIKCHFCYFCELYSSTVNKYMSQIIIPGDSICSRDCEYDISILTRLDQRLFNFLISIDNLTLMDRFTCMLSNKLFLHVCDIVWCMYIYRVVDLWSWFWFLRFSWKW